MTALWCIVGIGLLGAWLPVETRPWAGVAIAAVSLLLVPWAWARTDLKSARSVCMAVSLWSALVFFGMSGGWDRSQGLSEVGLVVLVAGVLWLSSRARPTSAHLLTWTIGISVLSVWGLLQSWGGLEHMRPAVDHLPPHLQTGALARIEQGRAFASLYLPGHLAVLLGTVLPILVARVSRDPMGIISGIAAACAAAGLMATRSPIGGVLAGGACVAVLAARRRSRIHVAWLAPIAAVVLAMGLRPDVLQLEPLRLRIENWGSAVWTWIGSPWGGVGLGGFGQASQAVPWEVGNHPVHAHALHFELLAELGVAGLALWVGLILFLFKVVGSLWRSRPEMAAALLIVPLHNLLDFSIYTSGVAIPWAVLAGWSLATVSPPTPSTKEHRGWRVIPVLVASGVLAVAVLNAASVDFEIAADRFFKCDYVLARRAAVLAPWRPAPVEVAGRCGLETQDPKIIREATELLRRRRWQRPRSASRAQLEGRLALIGHDPVAAAAHYWKAAQYQPHDSRRRRDFEILVEQLESQAHVVH